MKKNSSGLLIPLISCTRENSKLSFFTFLNDAELFRRYCKKRFSSIDSFGSASQLRERKTKRDYRKKGNASSRKANRTHVKINFFVQYCEAVSFIHKNSSAKQWNNMLLMNENKKCLYKRYDAPDFNLQFFYIHAFPCCYIISYAALVAK